ncbi:MAG: hypothetical protein O2800_07900, partial [Planctomycetota bacterium]|nr:hypothetical protein [Planctomycetota bacterium]
LAQDVRDWIANPESAFGWILRGDEMTPGSARRFDSSEGTNAQFAPSLEVEYSFVPAPPAAIAMLVAGAMFSRRRDRKGGLTVGMRPKQG